LGEKGCGGNPPIDFYREKKVGKKEERKASSLSSLFNSGKKGKGGLGV